MHAHKTLCEGEGRDRGDVSSCPGMLKIVSKLPRVGMKYVSRFLGMEQILPHSSQKEPALPTL